MQDRYAGDIGDFGKLGLLRALRSSDMSIGVNWYLIPDETHNGDGSIVDYLKYRECDESLWQGLREIIDSGSRSVDSLEDEKILQATFFSECLDFRGVKKRDRISLREEWFQRSLSSMADSDLVFVDPDNGLIVPSKVGTTKENKYVTPDELAAYYAQGSSLVYYQHKARYKDSFYVQQLETLVCDAHFPEASGIALKFVRSQVRYFLFLIQPRHRTTIEKAIESMLNTAWSHCFVRL